MQTKLVVLVRTDLRNTKGEKIRTGKLGAQIAHAALGAVLQKNSSITSSHILISMDEEMGRWLNSGETKIVLAVSSETELLDLYAAAKEHNLNAVLIVDKGLTEFGGTPTKTCVAIGPHYSSDIDKITGHLRPL